MRARHLQKHFALLAALFFLAATAAFFWPVLFGGRTLTGGDIVNQYLPYKKIVRDQLAQGCFPHWNPLTFSGRPLQADIQVGVFYPPNIAFYLLPLDWGFDLTTAFHFYLGSFGMALWVRRRTRHAVSALLAGILYMFSAFSTTRLMAGIVLFHSAMSWLPWLLLCWDRFLEGEKRSPRARARAWAALVAVCAMEILAGAPQIAFYSFFALGIYALVFAWRTRPTPNDDVTFSQYSGLSDLSDQSDQSDPLDQSDLSDSSFAPGNRLSEFLPFCVGPMLWLAAAIALAVGICAAQILPTLMFIGQSWDRAVGATWEYIVDGSLRLRDTIKFVAPLFFGDPFDEERFWGGPTGYHETTAFAGAVPILLLLAFLVLRWGRLRTLWFAQTETPPFSKRKMPARDSLRRFELFLLILLVLSVLLSFGRHSPFFWLAYHFVPGFDRFRVPARLLLFFAFAMSALAAWTLDRIIAFAMIAPHPTPLEEGPLPKGEGEETFNWERKKTEQEGRKDCVLFPTGEERTVSSPSPPGRGQGEGPSANAKRLFAPLLALSLLGLIALAALYLFAPSLMRALKMPFYPFESDPNNSLANASRLLEGQARQSIALFALFWVAAGVALILMIRPAYNMQAGSPHHNAQAGSPHHNAQAGSPHHNKPVRGPLPLAPHFASWALFALALVQLFVYGRHFLSTVPRAELTQTEYPRTERIEFLEKSLAPGERFLWFDTVMNYRFDQNHVELWTNRAAMRALPQLRGYDPVNSRRYGLFMNLLTRAPLERNPRGYMLISEDPPASIDWRLIALWNCRIALAYAELASPASSATASSEAASSEAAIEEAARWEFAPGQILHAYRLKHPSGPAWLAQPLVVPSDTTIEETLSVLSSNEFAPDKLALVESDEYAAIALDPTPRPGLTESVALTALTPNSERLSVSTPRPALLVLSQSAYPGWRARVDGVGAPVLRANAAQIAVPVEAGKHEIEVYYRPKEFTQGVAVSLASLLLLALIAFKPSREREEGEILFQ